MAERKVQNDRRSHRYDVNLFSSKRGIFVTHIFNIFLTINASKPSYSSFKNIIFEGSNNKT
jgi:hypothetical protein